MFNKVCGFNSNFKKCHCIYHDDIEISQDIKYDFFSVVDIEMFKLLKYVSQAMSDISTGRHCPLSVFCMRRIFE